MIIRVLKECAILPQNENLKAVCLKASHLSYRYRYAGIQRSDITRLLPNRPALARIDNFCLFLHPCRFFHGRLLRFLLAVRLAPTFCFFLPHRRLRPSQTLGIPQVTMGFAFIAYKCPSLNAALSLQ